MILNFKSSRKLLTAVAATVLFIVSPMTVNAQGNSTKEIRIFESGQVTDSDYFSAAETVQVLGTVNGDVYVAGGKVVVNGVIKGDVIAAGGAITVGGVVLGNVRAAGGDISLVGSVAKNVTVAAGSVSVSPEAKIGGNMLIFSGNTDISGKVGGDINYWGKNEAIITSSAVISGEVIKHETQAMTPAMTNVPQAFGTVTKAVSLLVTLVVGLFAIKLMPRYVKRASEEIMYKEFGKSLLRGMIALIAIPVILFILMITVVGIPIAVLGSMVFVVYLYFIRIFAIIAIGNITFRLFKNDGNVTKKFLVGLLIYYLLTLIPILGGLIKVVVLVAALGAGITNDRRTWAMARADRLI